MMVVVLVAAGAVVGLYFYNKNTKQNNSTAKLTAVNGESKTIDLNSNTSGTIPLGGNEQKEQNNNSLSVTNNAPTNSAQLGSGYKAPSNGSTSSGSETNSVPGPESFGQYEQYKTSQTSLYGDIQVGTGGMVTNGKKAAVIYKGYLTNGTLFDENVDANKPFVFVPGSGQVIRGWEESLPGMKAGGIRRIIVPPAAGYGSNDQGKIPANSVLVFDVQVVAVE